MIEVMVASAIMITLMLMLGMLFQQTSQAWRTGRQRADVLMKARALFGMVQRDVSAAVDKDTFPKHLWDDGALSGLEQSFSGSELKFFTLTGTGPDRLDIDPGPTPFLRSLTYITYDSSGRRKETVFLPSSSGGFLQGTDRSILILNSKLSGAQLHNVQYRAYNASGGSVSGGNYPAFITITAQATAQTNTFEIGAGSAGPNRQWGEGPNDWKGKDDIKTWID